MKTHLHFFSIAFAIAIDAHSQEDTFNFTSSRTDDPATSEEAIDLEEDPNFQPMLGAGGNCLLDSMDEILYFKILKCPNGVMLDRAPDNYPAFSRDGKPYFGLQYSAEMPDSIFQIKLDSIREVDFCFNDSIVAEDGSLENKVLDFVYNHVGRKVGTGICLDLVKEAYEYTDPDWYTEKWSNPEKYEVDSTEIQEGDVIIFDNVVYTDGTIAESHIGIVYNILSDGKISVAEQNVATSAESEKEYIQYYKRFIQIEKDSHVVISLLDMKQDIVSGKIRFYNFNTTK